MKILEWILEPKLHFPPQRDGDLLDDGVCIKFITDKIGLRQPTVTSHMRILCEAGLVSSKQIKNWVFYRPNRANIDVVLGQLNKQFQSRSS